ISGDWCQLLINKVIFITGGVGHLAKAIVKTCYAYGACFVLGDLDPEKTNKLKDEIVNNKNKADNRILVVKLDVTNETSIQQAVQTTLDKWTTAHVLLNSWSHVFDVNVCAYAVMAKHIAPIFEKQDSGSTMNIASSLGLIAIPNAVPDSATKCAIIQLTRNLALDLGSFNIHVNTISSDSIDSPGRDEFAKINNMTIEQMNDMCFQGSCLKRIGQPQDIANLIVFIISDLCQVMTDCNLVVDDGNLII
ncbi:unnamed protein product, partial [Rotaria sp. Silwood2]